MSTVLFCSVSDLIVMWSDLGVDMLRGTPDHSTMQPGLGTATLGIEHKPPGCQKLMKVTDTAVMVEGKK